MKTLAKGVYLHPIKSQQFKTNHLLLRFSAPMDIERVAARALLAQILVSASNKYPSSQILRKKLASLYGAQLSSRLSTKGQVHILDVEIAFASDSYLPLQTNLLEEAIELLKELIFAPLLEGKAMEKALFELEQTNLVAYLEADQEDSFYSSQLSLKELFYQDKVLAQSKYASPDLISKETAQSVYQELEQMLASDQIDMFLVGDFDEDKFLLSICQLDFTDRDLSLTYTYRQDALSNPVNKEDIKDLAQSVLALGYQIPDEIRRQYRYGLQVFNGLFGGFFHSKLFRELREKEGLAYSIGSQLDSLTGLVYVYAGTTENQQEQIQEKIAQQLQSLAQGDFSDQDIEQTKVMLKNNLIMAEDLVAAKYERAYNQAHLSQTGSLETALEGLSKVSRQDIQDIAQQLSLQAVYKLKGGQDDSAQV